MLKRFAPMVAVAALMSAFTSAPALAADFMTTRDYYSDATMTVLVGGAGNSCNNQLWWWGQVTPHFTVTREPCG